MCQLRTGLLESCDVDVCDTAWQWFRTHTTLSNGDGNLGDGRLSDRFRAVQTLVGLFALQAVVFAAFKFTASDPTWSIITVFVLDGLLLTLVSGRSTVNRRRR